MKNPLFLNAIAASICLCAPASAAFAITGNLQNEFEGQGYMAPLTDITVVSGTADVPSSATVICIDGSAHWAGNLGEPERHYVSEDTLPVDHPLGAEKALGMMHYVVDHYFDSVLTGDWGATPGYQFNLALWELTSDFNGDFSSLSTRAGGSYRDDSEPEYPLYSTIVDDLRTHFADISNSYRSTNYNLWIMNDEEPGMQTVLMVSPVNVPETSTVSILLGAVGVIGLRRRRR